MSCISLITQRAKTTRIFGDTSRFWRKLALADLSTLAPIAPAFFHLIRYWRLVTSAYPRFEPEDYARLPMDQDQPCIKTALLARGFRDIEWRFQNGLDLDRLCLFIPSDA